MVYKKNNNNVTYKLRTRSAIKLAITLPEGIFTNLASFILFYLTRTHKIILRGGWSGLVVVGYAKKMDARTSTIRSMRFFQARLIVVPHVTNDPRNALRANDEHQQPETGGTQGNSRQGADAKPSAPFRRLALQVHGMYR